MKPGRIVTVLAIICLAAIAGASLRTSSRPAEETAPTPKETKPVYPIMASGSLPIHIIYLATPDGKPEGPPNIHEVDLASGKRSVILSREKWPEEFRTHPDAVEVSSDGRYVAISAATDVEIDETQPGERVSDNIVIPAMKLVGAGTWLLDRRTGSFNRLLPEIDDYDWRWSPTGPHLLVLSEHVYVYDASTGKVKKCDSLRESDAAFWSGDGKGIVIQKATKSGISADLQPIDGSPRRRLFTRSVPTTVDAQAPDRSNYAMFDGEKVHILDAAGKQVQTFRIPDPYYRGDDTYWTDFRYNLAGTRLSILTSLSYGEPHHALEEQLWCVDLTRMKAVRVSVWNESLLGIQPSGDEFVDRKVLRWTPDGKSVLVLGQVTWGGEAFVDNRSDWYRLWAYDVTRPGAKGKLLFDSGPGCYGVAWW